MLDELESARTGDPYSVACLAQRLRPRIERMAAYYARRCGEDRDDLLQEAWLGLLEALPGVDPAIGSSDQYLVQCARWRMLDAARRSRRRRCETLDAADDTLCGAPEEASGHAHVGDFLDRLKSTQRDILECLLDGFTWREAGAALGFTSANVAYHMRQIRARYEAWDDA